MYRYWKWQRKANVTAVLRVNKWCYNSNLSVHTKIIKKQKCAHRERKTREKKYKGRPNKVAKKYRIGHKAGKLKYQKVALEEKFDLEMQQIVLRGLAWAWLGLERSKLRKTICWIFRPFFFSSVRLESKPLFFITIKNIFLSLKL